MLDTDELKGFVAFRRGLGEGALAAVLLSALPEGEKPLIVGKPNQPLLDIAQAA